MSLNAFEEIVAIKPVLREACNKYILPRFRNLNEKEIISDGNPADLVTRADLEASEFVLSWCKQRLPGSFSEEETSACRFKHDAVWCIDPLDGTEEFRQGKKTFCIQSSLLARTKHTCRYRAIGGIIYLPLLRVFVYATKKIGPFWEKDDIQRQIKPAGAQKSLKIAIREIDQGKKLDSFLEYALEKGIAFRKVSSGSAGHTFCMMLMQMPSSPNVFIFNRDFSKEWDLSPAANALEKAGWGLCDLKGKKFDYNRKDPRNRDGFVVAPKTRMTEVIGLIRAFGVRNLLESSSK
jgi:myo-inositol-1(or 4)-monophosphatase